MRVLVLLSLALTFAARGEVPDVSPEVLAERATSIVVGQVTNRSIVRDASDPNWDSRAFTYTVKVHDVEKGDLKRGDVVEFTAWRLEAGRRGAVGVAHCCVRDVRFGRPHHHLPPIEPGHPRISPPKSVPVWDHGPKKQAATLGGVTACRANPAGIECQDVGTMRFANSD